MPQKGYSRRHLWLHTIVMSLGANNRGECEENKTITVTMDVIQWSHPHCLLALLDGRLPTVGLLSSHLPKLYHSTIIYHHIHHIIHTISVLETVVSDCLSTARSWIMN